jgi:hypothetical protein
MIDAREPKNGDFVSYVEKLAKMPVGQVLPPASDDAFGHGAGRAGAGTPRQGGGARPAPAPPQGRDAEDARRAHKEMLEARREKLAGAGPAGREFAHQVSAVLRRVAAFATFAGIAMVALSFTDEPPFFAQPVLGIGLVVIGAVANRLSRKLA